MIEEVAVSYRDRPQGSVSKLNTVSDGVKVLKTIADLFRDYKPLLFFSIISLICIFFAAALFVPVLIEYFKSGLVLRFPTLIVSGVFAIIGILLWICGLILHVTVKKHRQLYELMLNLISKQ